MNKVGKNKKDLACLAKSLIFKWAHLESNQAPTDYESQGLHNFVLLVVFLYLIKCTDCKHIETFFYFCLLVSYCLFTTIVGEFVGES